MCEASDIICAAMTMLVKYGADAEREAERRGYKCMATTRRAAFLWGQVATVIHAMNVEMEINLPTSTEYMAGKDDFESAIVNKSEGVKDMSTIGRPAAGKRS
jgi:hypothetical protein